MLEWQLLPTRFQVFVSACHGTYSAHQGVERDDMNVLCMGARAVGPELMLDLVRAFMAARFTGEERHRRRLTKVLALEQRFCKEEARSP